MCHLPPQLILYFDHFAIFISFNRFHFNLNSQIMATCLLAKMLMCQASEECNIS